MSIFFLRKAKVKIRNVLQTNIQLGIYHIKNGNISDAVLRFKIINLFFSKHDIKSYYWLGWSYLLSQNVKKLKYAVSAFHHAEADASLIEFVQNYAHINCIPDYVLKEYRNITVRYYHTKILSYEILNNFFYTNLKPLLQSITDNSNLDSGNASCDTNEGKYYLLEIFNGNGILGKLIQKDFSNLILDGIEISLQMLQISHLFEIYADNYLISSTNYFADINNIQKKYDVILNAQSFGWAKNLDSIFLWVYNSLKDNGYFTLLVLISSDSSVNSYFHLKYFQFVYTESYIEGLIVNSGFIIQNQYDYEKSSSEEYFSMFILQKVTK